MSNEKKIPWLYLIIMSSVTFLAILSELVPSGILPQMSNDLGVNYSAIGNLISVYAIASAVGTIPLIAMTVEVNRKKLLTFLLLLFGVSNAIIFFTSNFSIIAVSRLIGGIAAGILWPMIAAYAIKLVPQNFQGRAIAITMSGSTLGLGIGMPIMTSIGTSFGWRIAFLVLSVLIFIVMFLVITVLPSVSGEKRSQSNNPLVLIKNKGIALVLILTFLTIMAHYALYTFISPLSDYIQIAGGIKAVSKIFGIGTIISVIIASKFIDSKLVTLNFGALFLALISLVIFVVFKGAYGISHLSFFIWGVSFGALVPLFQAIVTKQVTEGKDVATALQSSTFNFGIVFGSFIAGKILTVSSVMIIVYFSIVLLVLSVLVMNILKPYAK